MTQTGQALAILPQQQTRTARLSQAATNIGGVVTAVFMSAVLGFIVWALVFVEIPQQNVQLLTLVIGAILGSFATMVAYYFAGSMTATQSSDTNNKLATAVADQQLKKPSEISGPVIPEIPIPPGGTATATVTNPGGPPADATRPPAAG